MNVDFVIEQPADAADGQGGGTRGWTVFGESLGALESLSGAEKLAQAAPENTTAYIAWLPYVAGVNAKMQLRIGARILDIQDVTNINEQNLLLQINVTERWR